MPNTAPKRSSPVQAQVRRTVSPSNDTWVPPIWWHSGIRIGRATGPTGW